MLQIRGKIISRSFDVVKSKGRTNLIVKGMDGDLYWIQARPKFSGHLNNIENDTNYCFVVRNEFSEHMNSNRTQTFRHNNLILNHINELKEDGEKVV